MTMRSNFPDIVLADALPVLDALIMNEYEKKPDYVGQIFRVYSSTRWGEQTSNAAGIKAAVTKSEGTAYTFDSPIQGYDKTYTHTTYAIATSFSQETIEDDNFNLVEETYRSLGLSMYQTKQVTAFGVFNDGFGDTGPDGANLFSTSHTMIGGNTEANRPSSDIALSVAGIRSMEVSMMRQPNHRGIQINLIPKTIIVPPELSQDAQELIKSPEKPSTANRAINTIYSHDYNLIVSPYLTDTTAWFAIADITEHNLRFYERIAPNTKTWEDDKTGDINTRIRSRFSVGYSDWIGAWGTNP